MASDLLQNNFFQVDFKSFEVVSDLKIILISKSVNFVNFDYDPPTG